MVIGMMLFGSVARGDNCASSDVDVLAVSENGRPKTTKIDNMEIQTLNRAELMCMAKSGSLFALHLAYEGEVIFDSKQVFPEFREAVILKKSYSIERRQAADLAWFLYQYGGSFANKELVNKRVAWCVRTILISKLVERRRFIFSPAGLSSAFQFGYLEALINLRRSNADCVNWRPKLRQFLLDFESSGPSYKEIDEYRECFKITQNSVASSTLAALMKQNAEVYVY